MTTLAFVVNVPVGTSCAHITTAVKVQRFCVHLLRGQIKLYQVKTDRPCLGTQSSNPLFQFVVNLDYSMVTAHLMTRISGDGRAIQGRLVVWKESHTTGGIEGLFKTRIVSGRLHIDSEELDVLIDCRDTGAANAYSKNSSEEPTSQTIKTWIFQKIIARDTQLRHQSVAYIQILEHNTEHSMQYYLH